VGTFLYQEISLVVRVYCENQCEITSNELFNVDKKIKKNTLMENILCEYLLLLFI
jgi:hypothetical protein